MATAVRATADRRGEARARRGIAALLAWLALAAVAFASLWATSPPAPVPADAPTDQFSAERAFGHVEVVAAETHPAGSAANARVADYLVDVLGGLGLDAEVQDALGEEAADLSASAGGLGVGRVRNVVASLPGTDSTGRIVLVAHYDSIQVGPGGNDDGAGTATILETARALAAGDPLRNDVVFVLTDGEEAGLFGAQAFAATHPLAADGGIALNFEARGSSGPAIMFETSRANAGLVDLYGRAAPHPVGTSFAVEIYRLLPNDTDFTAFLDNGFTGLNTAYIDGAAVYHTPLDTPASMDRASLQHHGANALAVTRALGSMELSELQTTGDATYFPVPGLLVRYPCALTWPLAALAGLAVIGLAVLAVRRGRASTRGIVGGFALAAIPLVAAPAAAWLLWAGVGALRPGYAEMVDPYRPTLYRLAVLVLTAAVLLAWHAVARRWVGPAAAAIGGLAWLAVFGLALAALVPGGSYLAALPALAGGVAGLAALVARSRGDADARAEAGGRSPRLLGPVAAVAAGAVAVLVLVPAVSLLFPALGLRMGFAGALIACWLGLALLPAIDVVYGERQQDRADRVGERVPGGPRGSAGRKHPRAALPALIAVGAAAALTVTGLAVDRFDADHPRPTHLMYALDLDTGQARWLSRERSPAPWTAQYVDEEVRLEQDFPAIAAGFLRAGPAPAAALPAPVVTPVSDTTDEAAGTRTLVIRVAPAGAARFIGLHADVAVREAAVDGRPLDVRADVRDGTGWPFGVVFHSPPPEGFELALVVPAGPVALRALQGSDGLAGLPGFVPRPPDVGVAGSHSSELVAVARTDRF